MTTTNLIEDLRLLSPPSFSAWWIALAAVCLSVCFFLILRRRRGRERVSPEQQLDPDPWQTALAELEHLLPLLSHEHSRDYAIKATGILRRYIEARYLLEAPKLATEEFLLLVQDAASLSAEERATLQTFLGQCDLLKFGRYTAAGAELEKLHTAAVEFVVASRPVAPAEVVQEGTA